MGNEITVSKLKSAELKALAKDIGLHLIGKEKKNELSSLIGDAIEEKLIALAVDDIRVLAADLKIYLPDNSAVSDIVNAIKPAMTDASTRRLFASRDAAADSMVDELDQIAGELIDVEADIEKVVHDIEHIPAPDMADIYLVDQRLADVVKLNIDFANVASMLDVGRIKFLDRKYLESMSLLSEAIKASEEMISQYCDITHAFIILSAEKILEECRESNSNNEKAADLLIQAKRSFSEKGKNRAESIKALSEIANTVYREEVVFLEERIAKVEPLISAMKVQGVDVFNAERYIHRAREAFLVGELASVNSNLDKSLNMANESKNVWVQEIKNDIPRVESILKQAKDLGADISEAEKHLAQANVAFNNQDYSLCSELKKIAERKAIENQHLQIQKAAKLGKENMADAEKILATLAPLMREAEAYHIPTMEFMGAVNAAKNAIMNNDYVNALTYAKDAETRSKPIWTQIKDQREQILSSGEPLQVCQTCNSHGIKVFPSGKAVCVHCGMVYDIQVRAPQPESRKGWFRK